MTLPLEGITVVSLEQAVAGPLATRQLADLGARVIKVERVDGGDLARGYDSAVEGTAAHFVWLNRGKESLALDVKDARCRAALSTLVDRADVLVQNLAPGAAARLGLDADTVRRRRPELIAVDLSGFGRGGPDEQRKAYDMLIQAEAGLISITGTPEHAVKTGIPTADIASGMYVAQAVLAALLRRFRTGEGASVEVSMLEATVEWLGHALYTQMHTGNPPARMGLSHTSIAPYGAYPTKDDSVLIGVQSDGGWRALTRVLAAPDLDVDPRFASNVQRVRHRAELDAALAARTRSWTTVDLVAALGTAGVPAAQVKGMADVIEHRQLAARGRWREVGTEHARVRALLPPATFDDVEAPMLPVPALGEHTEALLAEPDLTPDEIAELIDAGLAVAGARARQDPSEPERARAT
ncbi:MAG: CoA transferase [Pseudorhodobacter sp.]|nr:CoA transferase [Frankiaceae bacterium]